MKWVILGIVTVVWLLVLYEQRNVIKFWWAKHTARRKNKETGKRYYVIPSKDKLHIISTRQVNYLNRKIPKAKRINIFRLLRDSYFHTK